MNRSRPVTGAGFTGGDGRVDGPAVLPVSLLVSSARLLLERHLGLAWVSGEISGFTRAASGHCYFNLKDEKAQVRCVFFRHKAQHCDFAPRDGLEVEVRATPSIYEARGDFQLNVETMRLAGLGALYERFARLKARLESAGWFSEERKRPIPPHPSAVGIVTSLQAAALRDVLTTLRRRWPALGVVIYPTAVQGEAAAAEIAAALRVANARAEVDVLIVCRGGGSIEDLWPFNEEIVARAVYESALPVVSGVGHETDFTICDFVADARAATPTAAAALVSPDGAAIGRTLAAHAARWRASAQRALENRMQRVDALARQVVHPAARIASRRESLRLLRDRLGRAQGHRVAALALQLDSVERQMRWTLRRPLPQAGQYTLLDERFRRGGAEALDRLGQRLTLLARSLEHLDPSAVLERGYAIAARPDGTIITDAASVAPGDAVDLSLAKGRLHTRVIGREG